MRTWRYVLGVTGVLLGLYGVFGLVTDVSFADLFVLGLWSVGAVVIHDGVLTPVVLGVGALLSRVPPRGRRYLQGALVVGGLVTVVALPLIALRGSQPPQKAILQANYAVHLTVLLGVIAAASLLLYALHVARDARGRTTPSGETSER